VSGESDADVGRRQRGSVVGSVANHQHDFTPSPEARDHRCLVRRQQLSMYFAYPCSAACSLGICRPIAGQKHRPRKAQLSERCEKRVQLGSERIGILDDACRLSVDQNVGP